MGRACFKLSGRDGIPDAAGTVVTMAEVRGASVEPRTPTKMAEVDQERV